MSQRHPGRDRGPAHDARMRHLAGFQAVPGTIRVCPQCQKAYVAHSKHAIHCHRCTVALAAAGLGYRARIATIGAA